ncbi:hypothetical protein [Yonghaparkia sp. Root332]|uniref:hypothetical protein n=1 Tax=Yonghaparkia sp. Root332 TaxID=1736516 RepID=UPI001F2B30FF|nr:hypothetical protein [Yonghaparkia sp. Root332]
MNWLSSLAPLTVGPGPVDDPGDPLIPPIEVDPNSVTPGVVGFLAIALVTIAAILLIIDMARRVRRVRYRGEVREQLEAERAEAALRAANPGASAAEGRVEGDEQDPRPVA